VTPSFLASRSPWPRLAIVGVWAVALALVEATVVYYLRKLFALEFAAVFTARTFHFPSDYLVYERGRETATMVMLVTVALLAGRTLWQAFAYWLFAFGVWDVFYYVWLWVLLGWPNSLRTRDLLFLIPEEWWAPVWLPISVSAGFIVVAVLILRFTRRA